MAKANAPFGEGTPFYKGFSQIADFYNAGVMGPDPLGIGWDQATDLFVSKKAAVVAAGLWFLPTYESKVGSADDLAAFPMPYRQTKDTPLKLMTFTDHFYGISNSSKHQDEAKAFIEWFYSPEVYQTYLDQAKLGSTFKGVEANVPFLKAFNEQYKPAPFLYIPGDGAYTELSNSIQLDVKALGQEMMSGRKVADIAKDLNTKWEKAKNNK
ncbi:extracellular solute-binding protein [Paenibacillus puerhi]|uniref:extracellular solute-binding protein n=1 Tax=Paenibacillus puerhi TaxID=2692622 RepID=UPI00135766DF|nr:extracellular solute-binding protein [Paenibacillus puerhi]